MSVVNPKIKPVRPGVIFHTVRFALLSSLQEIDARLPSCLSVRDEDTLDMSI